MEFKLEYYKLVEKFKDVKDFILKKSLRTRIMIQFLLVILLIVVFFEIFLIFTIKNYYYSGVTGVIQSQAKYSAKLYETYLANSSLSELVLDDIEEFYSEVNSEVQILNNSGKVLLDTVNGNHVGKVLSSSDVISAKNGSNGSYVYKNSISNKNELAVSIPLNNGNEQVGIARFIISLENIDRIIAQRYLVFFLFGFFVIVIGVSISIFMNTKIVNPIEKLTNVALKLADGQLNEKADEVGDYEISKLGSTMNLMSENLVKKEQLKKDFISSISHELRTPLTVIKGWAFTLQPEAKGNKLLEDGLSIIEKESDRLGNMVTELLDFSELSSGRLIMNKELFDLNELGIFINKQLMPKSSSKKIDMILNYDETKRVMVIADRDRIKQVFINILDNALKFTDEGGVVLTDIKIEDDIAVVEVIDNGCGISEDEISLVTGKFYKGSNSNSHTGLGLSICEEIVKAHNGNLIIRSVLEKGTVVRVELPLEKGELKNEI